MAQLTETRYNYLTITQYIDEKCRKVRGETLQVANPRRKVLDNENLLDYTIYVVNK